MLRRSVMLGTALCALVGTVEAQNVGTVSVQAAVIDPLAVLPVRDLDFGNVPLGTTVTVLPSDATAGLFRAIGENRREVDIAFVLPGELTAPSGATMPISFAGNTGLFGWTLDPTDQTTAFDPAAGTTARVSPPPFGSQLFIWLGGAVTVSPTQAPGQYSAPIVVTVTYTGA